VKPILEQRETKLARHTTQMGKMSGDNRKELDYLKDFQIPEKFLGSGTHLQKIATTDNLQVEEKVRKEGDKGGEV